MCSSDLKLVATPLDDDEVNGTIEGQLLSLLVGEVTEVGMDEDMLGSIYDLYASGQKSKSAKNKKGKNPRKTAKLSKSPSVSR